MKYIIFLVDADTLFDVALGMYDFSLVLLVAQHAQKVPYLRFYGPTNMLRSFQDPREYLPFLRELRALEKYYQRFRIDDHLKRYKSALRNLSLAGLSISLISLLHPAYKLSPGPEHFDDVKEYVEKHQLYETALEIFGETDQLRVRSVRLHQSPLLRLRPRTSWTSTEIGSSNAGSSANLLWVSVEFFSARSLAC